MGDVTKLPKWAQEEIAKLKHTHYVSSATIEDVSVEMNGFKHDENSAKAIIAIAEALEQNAVSLGMLSEAVVPKNLQPNFGSAIHIESPKWPANEFTK